MLLAAVGAISALGVLMVYSATRGVEKPYDTSFVTKQFMYVVLGVTAMAIVVALIDYRTIRDVAPFIYGASILLLDARAGHRSARARTARRAGSSSARSSCSRPSSPSSA